MKQVILTCALVLSGTAFAQASTSCLARECPAGTNARTSTNKSDVFYACPTQQLAEYTTIVLAIVTVQVSMGKGMPNISDKTGDPVYEDGDPANSSNQLISMLREKAGVPSFDAALRVCALGQDRRQITVMNAPQKSVASYVVDVKSQRAYWMPRSHLNAR